MLRLSRQRHAKEVQEDARAHRRGVMFKASQNLQRQIFVNAAATLFHTLYNTFTMIYSIMCIYIYVCVYIGILVYLVLHIGSYNIISYHFIPYTIYHVRDTRYEIPDTIYHVRYTMYHVLYVISYLISYIKYHIIIYQYLISNIIYDISYIIYHISCIISFGFTYWRILEIRALETSMRR